MANLTKVDDHYVIAYENSWQQLLQQQDARLKERTKLVAAKGAAVRFNQLGLTSMAAVSTKNASTPNTDISMPTRWAYPTPYDVSNIIDEFDEFFLGSVSNPSSEIMQSQLAAYNRTVDSILITALTGSAVVTDTTTKGIPTTTTSAYDTTNQQIAVNRVPFGGTATNSGLTIDKVRYAKYKLDKAEAPAEDRILVVSAAEIADLLSTTEVTNQLYNSVRALVDGTVDSFLGFKVVRTELLGVSSNVRTCIAYQKNAAVLCDGGRRSYMDIRADLSHGLQIRSTAIVGATRLLDNGVVTILTDTTKQ
jgi:Phage capsid protein